MAMGVAAVVASATMTTNETGCQRALLSSSAAVLYLRLAARGSSAACAPGARSDLGLVRTAPNPEWNVVATARAHPTCRALGGCEVLRSVAGTEGCPDQEPAQIKACSCTCGSVRANGQHGG